MDKTLTAGKLMLFIKSFFCITLAAFAMEASAGYVYVTKTKCCRYVKRYYVKPRCCVRPSCTYYYGTCGCSTAQVNCYWDTYGNYYPGYYLGYRR